MVGVGQRPAADPAPRVRETPTDEATPERPTSSSGVQLTTALIVLNFGSHALIERNFGALDRRVVPLRMVIVDNFSSAAERAAVEAVATRHGWDFVPLPGNNGFGAGVNAGLRHAADRGCTVHLILNPDTVVEPGVLAALARQVQDSPLSVVSPRLVDAGGGHEFLGAHVLLRDGRIRGIRDTSAVTSRDAVRVLGSDRDVAARARQGGPANRSGEPGAAWLSGACLAIHQDLLDRVGLFDEPYFMYWEDVDFSVRCERAGGSLVVRNDLCAMHDEGGTQGERRGRAKSNLYYYYNCRNRLLFATRHLGPVDIARWMRVTPAVSWEILLRGGRRQLLQSPGPATAALRGTAAGLSLAAAALLRSMTTADRTRPGPAPARRNPVARSAGGAGAELAVTVAVLTFRRPSEVVQTVAKVLEQAGAAAGGPGRSYTFDVVVVDNDPAASAAGIFGAFRHTVRYVHEPTPGISAARNRALDESPAADLLIFVDDDERPEPGWLEQLLRTHSETGAAAVAGAVVSSFESPLSDWLAAGGFFDRRRLPTGTEVGAAATNNLLLELAEVRRLGLRFGAGFGLSGGEDTMFTRTLVQQGRRVVWCDEAVVLDIVPAARMTKTWVLARAFRSGNSWSRVGVDLSRTPPEKALNRARYAGLGLPRIGTGLARFTYGVATGSMRHRARGLRTAARGVGMTTGAFGFVRHEYPRTAAPTVAAPGRGRAA